MLSLLLLPDSVLPEGLASPPGAKLPVSCKTELLLVATRAQHKLDMGLAESCNREWA